MKTIRSSDVSEAIGDASNWFSVIELLVVDVAASLINPRDHRIGEIVCDPLSLSQTLNLIACLVDEKRPELQKEIASATKALRTASSKRNDLLHSAWIYIEDTGRVAQLRPRKRHLDLTPHSFSSLLNHIEGFIEELRPVYEAWGRILNQLEIEKHENGA